MKEKIAKLIDVRTIVTFTIVGVFAYLSVTNKIPVEDVKLVLTMIITFFFVKKADETKI
jgi:hypothetical protein